MEVEVEVEVEAATVPVGDVTAAVLANEVGAVEASLDSLHDLVGQMTQSLQINAELLSAAVVSGATTLAESHRNVHLTERLAASLCAMELEAKATKEANAKALEEERACHQAQCKMARARVDVAEGKRDAVVQQLKASQTQAAASQRRADHAETAMRSARQRADAEAQVHDTTRAQLVSEGVGLRAQVETLEVEITVLQRNDGEAHEQLASYAEALSNTHGRFRDLLVSSSDDSARTNIEMAELRARLELLTDRLAAHDGDGQECSICMGEPPHVAFGPCGHVCCCSRCSATVDRCPVCRVPIESRLRVYR